MPNIKINQSMVILTLDDYNDMNNQMCLQQICDAENKKMYEDLLKTSRGQADLIDELQKQLKQYSEFVDRSYNRRMFEAFKESGEIRFAGLDHEMEVSE